MVKQLTLALALPPPTFARGDFVLSDGNREALAWLDRWPDWPAPALAQVPPDWTSVALVAAVFVLGNMLEGNVLSPKLVGDRVGLHPVWIMFALLAGGALFGFVGVLIAVPVAAVVGVLVRHLIGRYRESQYYRGADAA